MKVETDISYSTTVNPISCNTSDNVYQTDVVILICNIIMSLMSD